MKMEVDTVIDITELETLTTITIDTAGQTITYRDEDGVDTVIDIAALETTTTIQDTVAGHRIATYTNEEGDVYNVNETITSLVGIDSLIIYENEAGGFDTIQVSNLETSTNITNVQLAGKIIGIYTNEDGDQDTIRETITILTYNDITGDFTYTNEDGSITTFNLSDEIDTFETLTTITIDTAGQTITYRDEDGSDTVIDITELETLTTITIDTAGQTITYRDEDGNDTVVDISVLETTTTIQDTVAGNLIATYTNEEGDVYNVNETITSILGIDSLIIYQNEIGEFDTIQVSSLETTTTIQDTIVGHRIATYTNEDGDVYNVNETITSILGIDSLIIYQNEAGGFDTIQINNLETTTNITSLQLAGKIIGIYTNEDGDQDTIRETITTLTYDDITGDFSYTNEDGTVTTFNLEDEIDTFETLTTITIDTAGQTITYRDEDGNDTVIDITELETLTTITIDTAGQTVTYRDEDGVDTVIDISELETTTTIQDTVSGHLIATYTNEEGDIYNVNETITSLVGIDSLIIYENEAGGFDTIDISGLETTTNITSLQLAGKIIGIYTNEDGDQDTIRETITILTYNDITGDFSYTNEDGTVTTFNLEDEIDTFETLTTITIDTAGQTITYRDEDGNDTVIDITELETLTTITIDTAGQTVTYRDEDGVDTVIDISELETTTTIQDTVSGHLIATYTNEEGDIYNVNETITSLVGIDSLIIYENEAGGFDTIDISGLETTTNITSLQLAGKIIGIYTNEDGDQDTIRETITILTYNDITGDFSYTNEDGTVTTFNLEDEIDTFETLTTITIDTAGQTITYRDEDGNDTVIDITELETLTTITIDTAGQTVTYRDEDGVDTVIDIAALETTTTIQDTVSGHLIATYTNEEGDIYNVNETITSLVGIDSLIIYENEAGGFDTIDISGLETTTNITSLQLAGKIIGIYTNEDGDQDTIRETITILTYNDITGDFSYTNEDGTVTTFNLEDEIDTFETLTTITIDTAGQTITYRDEDGNDTVIDITELETLTTITIDTAGQTVTYRDEDGVDTVIDISELETTTTIQDTVSGHLIATYTNEEGDIYNVNETITSLVGIDSLIIYENEAGGFDTIDISGLETTTNITNLQLAGKIIGIYTNEDGDQDTIRETITILTYNDITGDFSYTNEDGTITTFNLEDEIDTFETLTTITIDTSGQTITYRDEDGNDTVIDITELETLTTITIDTAGQTVTYRDEDGVDTVIDIAVLETTTTMQDTVSGHLIATYTNEEGDIYNVNETITSLVGIDSLIIYENEAGGFDTVDISGLETTTNITSLQLAGKIIGIYTNEDGDQDTIRETITILTYDDITGDFSYTNEDGTITTFNLSDEIDTFETLTTITIDTAGQTITYRDEDGNDTVIDITELETLTTITIDTAGQTVTYRDEDGVDTVIDIAELETTTTIQDTVTGHRIATYTNEEGDIYNVNETITSLVGIDSLIIYENEAGGFDTVDISGLETTTNITSLQLAGKIIGIYTNEDGDQDTIRETITILTYDDITGDFSYTNEDGTITTFNLSDEIDTFETLTTITIDTSGQTITYRDEDGNDTVIDITELETLTTITIDTAGQTVTYRDEDGVDTVIDIAVLETTTTIQDTVSGHLIATYTNEEGDIYNVNETITSLVGIDSLIIYENEAGGFDTVDISGLETTTNITSLQLAGKIIGIYTNEDGDQDTIRETITILTYNDITGDFSYTNEDGTVTTFNLEDEIDTFETLTTITIDTAGQTITYRDEDGNDTVIDITELETLTTITIDTAGQTVTYRDEDGVDTVIDISELETTTTIQDTVSGHLIATYTNEEGDIYNVNETITSLVGIDSLIIYENEAGGFDTIDISGLETTTNITNLQLAGKIIGIYTNEDGDQDTIRETITILTYNDITGDFSYTNEDGTITTFNLEDEIDTFETLTTITIDTSGQTITYRDEDGNDTVIDITELETLTTITIDTAGQTVTYRDEDGVDTVIDIAVLETTTTMQDTVSGHLIATYTNEEGDIYNVNETITSLVGIDSLIIYENEAGGFDTVDISGLETTTNITSLQLAGKIIGIYTNEDGDQDTIRETITILTYDDITGDFSYTNEDGTITTFNLSDEIDTFETLTTITIDTAGQTITYRDEDGNDTVIDITELETLTTITIDTAGQTVTYRDEDGVDTVIDIAELETTTTIQDTVTGHRIATYTNEEGDIYNVNETITSLVGIDSLIIYENEAGGFDTVDISGLETTTNITSLQLAGKIIGIYTNEDGDQDTIRETITILTYDDITGDFSYTNEDGTITTFNLSDEIDTFETLTTITIDTSGQTITYRDEDGNDTVIDITELETLTTITIDTAGQTVTYRDEDGVDTVIDIAVLETTTTIQDTVSGHLIATYTNEEGDIYNVNETITSLVGIDSLIIYENEAGGFDTVDISGLETTTNITSLQLAGKIIGIYTNEDGDQDTIRETITILTYNDITGDFSYTNEDGTITTFNLEDEIDTFETLTTITIDTAGQTITYRDEDGNDTVIDITELETLTTITIDTAGQTVTYRDEDGVDTVIDIAELETTTTIQDTVTGHRIATYTNEEGDIYNINETITSLVGIDSLIIYENEAGGFDTVDISGLETTTNITNLQLAGKIIGIYTNEDGDQDTIRETITILTYNDITGDFSYTNEDGTITTFNLSDEIDTFETLTTITIDTSGQTITYRDEDGNDTVIDITELETLTTITIDTAGQTVTYRDEDGVDTVIDIAELETTTTIQDTVTGHRIATYTNEEGDIYNINETITSLVGIDSLIIYENEAGGFDTVDISGLETTTNITNLQLAGKIIGIYTNEDGDQDTIRETITILTYDDITGDFSYTNEDGTVTTFNLEDEIDKFKTLTTITIDTAGQTITYRDEDGNDTVIDITELETLTTITIDTAGQTVTYRDEDGVDTVMDITALETTTTVQNTVAGNRIATYTNEDGTDYDINETVTDVRDVQATGKVIATYENEEGTIDSIKETITNLEGDANQLIYIGENGRDTIDISTTDVVTDISNVQLVGKVIGVYTNEDGDQDTIKETITVLTYNDITGDFSYTNEDGTITTFNLSDEIDTFETLTTITIDTAGQTVTYKDEDGNDTVIDITELETLTTITIDVGGQTVTYKDEDGNDTVIDITALETTTTVQNTVAGNRIATYTNEDGTDYDINETVTDVRDVQATGKVIATYENEEGTIDSIKETITNLEGDANQLIYIGENGRDTIDISTTDVVTDISNVQLVGKVIGVYTNEDGDQDTIKETITVLTYNDITGDFSYTNEDGTITTFNLSDEIDTFETLTTITIDTAGQTVTYKDEDGNDTVIDITELETLTTITIDVGGQTVTYKDEDGNDTVMDITALETATTVQNTVAGNRIATYTNEDGTDYDINETVTDVRDVQATGKVIATYENEEGTIDSIKETITNLEGDANQLIYIGENGRDTIDISTTDVVTDISNVQLVGKVIGVYTNEDGDQDTIKETITVLTYNDITGDFSYTNEDGTITTFNLSDEIDTFETLTTITIDTAGQTVTYKDEDGNDTVIDITELETLTTITIDVGGQTVTYKDEDGNDTVMDITALETTTTVQNTVAGNRIATYTNEDGTDYDINETVTDVRDVQATGKVIATYENEEGTIDSIKETITNLEGDASQLIYIGENGRDTIDISTTDVVTDISNVQLVGKVIGVYTNEDGDQDTIKETITVLTYNDITGDFSYTNEDGTITTFNLSDEIDTFETLTTITIDTAGQTVTYKDEDGNDTVIDITELETLTTITIDVGGQTVTYKDEDGNDTVIDITALETTTTVQNTVAGNRIATYTNEDGTDYDINETVTDVRDVQATGKVIATYENEEGTIDSIKETITNLEGDASQLIYIGENGRDTIDISTTDVVTDISNVQLVGKVIGVYTNEDGDQDTIKETITVLTYNDITGDFSYTNEDGTITTFNLSDEIDTFETLTTIIIDTAGQTVTYKDEDGNDTVIDITELETLTTITIDVGGQTLTYKDEDGNDTVIDITALETTTTVQNTVAGNRIATYTNEDGTDYDINETVTDVRDVQATGKVIATYENEEGTIDSIKETITNLEGDASQLIYIGENGRDTIDISTTDVVTDISNVQLVGKVIGVYTNEDGDQDTIKETITVLTYNDITGDFSYTNEDGTITTFNLSDEIDTFETLTTITIDTAGQTVTYKDEDGNDTVIDITELETLTTITIDVGGQTVTYKDEDGNDTVMDITALETTTTVQNTVAGNRIATYTNEDGTDYDINETVTDVRDVQATGKVIATYENEEGTIDSIKETITNLEGDASQLIYIGENGRDTIDISTTDVVTDISNVQLVGKVIGVYTNEDGDQDTIKETITVLTYNDITGDFSYTNEDGTITTFNLSDEIDTFETLTTITIDTAGQTVTYKDEDGNDTVIDITELETLTTITIDVGGQTVTYKDEDGNDTVIDITALETTTTVQNTVAGNRIATYTNEDGTDYDINETVTDVRDVQATGKVIATYENEEGTIDSIKETITNLEGDASQLIYIGENGRDTIDISTTDVVTDISNVQLVGKVIGVYTNEDGDQDTIKETITVLTYNDITGDFSYTNEDGTITTFNLSDEIDTFETLTTIIIDTAGQTVTYKDEDGNDTVIDITELETLTTITIDVGGQTLTYKDEDGNDTVIDITALETTTTVQNTVAGNRIATYTNEDGTDYDINETVTDVRDVQATGKVIATYENEEGTIDSIKETITNLEGDASQLIYIGENGRDTIDISTTDVVTDISNVQLVGKVIGVYTNEDGDQDTIKETITVLTYNDITGDFSYTNEDGTITTFNLSDEIDTFETLTTITIDTAGQTVTYKDEDGNDTVIDITELETLTTITIDVGGQTVTYKDEDGNDTVMDITALETTTTVQNTVAGNRIATYTNEDGTDYDINETVTDVRDVQATGKVIATYENEEGTIDSIKETITNLEGDASQLIYIGENGRDTINISTSDVITEVESTQALGNEIGIYRNESGARDTIRETITSIDSISKGVYEYTQEDGAKQTINIYSANSIAEIYDVAGGQALTTTMANITFATAGIVDAPDYTNTTNSITIGTSGRYRVTYRVTTRTTNNTRSGAEFELTNNTVVVAGSYASTYQRNRDVDRNTIAVTKVLSLTAGDVLRVQGKRYSNFGNLQTVANGSSLLIERLK